MSKKEGFKKKTGDFLAGKGFYIALILCVAVIGASAWAMLGSRVGSGDGAELDLPVIAEIDEVSWAQAPAVVPATPAPTPMPTPPAHPTRPQPDRETMAPAPIDEGEATWIPEGTPEEPASPPPEEMQTQPSHIAPEDMQFVWPVAGEIVVPHSVNALIFDHTMGDWRTHAGVDISADLGERVRAVTAGTVERIFHDDLMGTTVVIYHGGGLQSLYSNLAELPTVQEGQWVELGAFIGAVGNTSLAESGIVNHLHLEIIRDGVQVDPADFLPER